jgi:hypothetical protein
MSLAVALLAGAGAGGCAPGGDERKVTSVRRADRERTGGGLPSEPGAEGCCGPLLFRAQELPFRYERGESGAAWPVEVTGGGVGLLDYDGDGDLDLFFAQGVPLPVRADASGPNDVLLRNDGGGRFVDVSAEVGLVSKGYGQGVTVADYDADGDPDVYVTRYGANTLWRNDGSAGFHDVADETGVGCPLWSLGAAFLDLDGDGDLDLFVANYFDFDPNDAPFERTADGAPEYGTPERFVGQPDVLYRNDGGGWFRDVTAETGIVDRGRGMGCLAGNLLYEGNVEILVANDAEANSLWAVAGRGTFENRAALLGIDLNAAGVAEANMGIARGDTDGDGTLDVMITHFVNEHDTLWRGHRLGEGGVVFQDGTYAARLGTDSRPMTGWGIVMADFDLDGHIDIMVVNGHIRREPSGALYEHDNPPILWHNDGTGRFVNVTASAGPYFQDVHQARGLAAGDLDGDGDLDLVVVHHAKNSVVLWNESPRRGRWLALDLTGSRGNRDAIGAMIELDAGGRRLVRAIDGGGSYLSSSSRLVHFGLGPTARVDRATVRWPSGRSETRADLPVDGVVHWIEGAPE